MNIRKLPSGSWQVSIMCNGVRRSTTASSKEEAKRLGAEMLLEMGGSTKQAGATVADLVHAWQASATLSSTFRADAKRVIDKMPEAFTRRTAASITPSIVEGLYRQLQRDGWTVHRISRLHTVLSTAWTLGRRWEWVRDNPFTAARRPSAPKAKIHPPTPAQVHALLDGADGVFRLFLFLSAAIGARRGEVVALQWQDVAEDGIVVRRSLAYAPESGVVETDGKTGAKGHRVVAIDADLAVMLRAHRRQQVELALAAGLPAPVWVFSHDAGVTPWRPDYASREFRELRRRLGLPESIRMHDLRHFVATELLAAGVPLKVVSERLGHRQLATTADTYGHYVPAADRQAADVMARLRGAN